MPLTCLVSTAIARLGPGTQGHRMHQDIAEQPIQPRVSMMHVIAVFVVRSAHPFILVSLSTLKGLVAQVPVRRYHEGTKEPLDR